MSITLGLAENYAMLGNKYLYMYNAGTVQGFMGSDFLSYPPPGFINLDSNGIYLGSGTIPNAPIVNGAAAKQAIADVTTAVGIMNTLPNPYGIIPVNTFTFSGNQDLDAILTTPITDEINVYKITTGGNLTMTADVDFDLLNLSASTVCIFIVEGNITINYNIIRTGGILPQNIIFIGGGANVNIGTSTVIANGIYISTVGEASIFNDSKLTGRLISTNGTSYIYNGSDITAPQFA